MLHPISTHFAVVLPIVSLAIGFAFVLKPTDQMSKISSRLMLFSAIFMIIAFFTGKHDGTEVYMLISGDGQLLLKEHKTMGLYLAIAMGIVALIKMFGCYKKSFKIELFAVVLVALVAVGVFYQGKMGGELTYKYGANVEKHSDGMECLDDPEEFLEE